MLSPSTPQPRPSKKRPPGKLSKSENTDSDNGNQSEQLGKRRGEGASKGALGGRNLKRPSSVITSSPSLEEVSLDRVSSSATPKSHLTITTTSSQLSPGATDENVYVDPETKHRYYANHAGLLAHSNSNNNNNTNVHNNISINNNNNITNVNNINTALSQPLPSHNSQVTPMRISFQSNCIRARHDGHTTPKSSQSQWPDASPHGTHGHHKPAKLKRRWLEAALEQSYEEDIRAAKSSLKVDHGENRDVMPATSTPADMDYNHTDIYIKNEEESFNYQKHQATTFTNHGNSKYSNSSTRPSVLVMAHSTSPSEEEQEHSTPYNYSNAVDPTRLEAVSSTTTTTVTLHEEYQYATFHGSNGMCKKFHTDDSGHLIIAVEGTDNNAPSPFDNHDQTEQYHIIETIVPENNHSYNNHLYYRSNHQQITSGP